MKVIFLDIDGVLNSEGFRPENPNGLEDWLDERNVRVLGRLVEATGARIVVTSSWRLSTPLHEIEGALAMRGATISLAGATPSLGLAMRAEEIRKWLSESSLPIESWVAVDDDWLDLGERFHRVSRLSGLTDSDISDVECILDIPHG